MTDTDDNGRQLTSEPGEWISVQQAAARLKIRDRSVRRMVAAGRLLRRLRQGKAEVWVSESMTSEDDTDESIENGHMPSRDGNGTSLDGTDMALAVIGQQRALIERLNELAAQQMAPLLQKLDDRDTKIQDLERENGRLQAELAAVQQCQMTSVDLGNRPWWRRWFGL